MPPEWNSRSDPSLLPSGLIRSVVHTSWSRSLRQPSVLRGILLTIIAWSLFPTLDAIAKYLAGDYSVIEIVWARFLAQFAVAAALLGPRRLRTAIRTPYRTLQFGRSLGFAVHTILFIAAITYLPLADAIALLFVGPLMVTALSSPLLGETVGLSRWLGVLVGFLGAIVIIRPGFGVFHWATILVLLSAACFALYQLATRELSSHEDPLTTLFYTPAAGLAVMSALVPFFWTTPTADDALLMALMGGVGAFAHFMLIKAYESAEASSLAPFSYVLIVSATILGYAVFGDLPDAWTVIGALIVIAGGLYVGRREARAARAPLEPGGQAN